MVLAHNEGSGLKLVMNNDELAAFKGDPQPFMERLKEKLTSNTDAAPA